MQNFYSWWHKERQARGYSPGNWKWIITPLSASANRCYLGLNKMTEYTLKPVGNIPPRPQNPWSWCVTGFAGILQASSGHPVCCHQQCSSLNMMAHILPKAWHYVSVLHSRATGTPRAGAATGKHCSRPLP